MARQARVKDDFGVFYIYQQGGGCRKLFECNEDRNKFLAILKKAQAKFQFKLHAYCVLTDDAYHLVIDVNGGDLSKIMKSINIAYAMYAHCEGKLFKDRYKSKLLPNDMELSKIINQIHGNAKESSIWNSYCAYDSVTPINMDWLDTLPFKNDEINCIGKIAPVNPCKDCIKSVPEAKAKLKTLAAQENRNVEQLILDKDARNRLIKEFRKHSTLSLKELGEIFGGLTESSVCKILNKDNED